MGKGIPMKLISVDEEGNPITLENSEGDGTTARLLEVFGEAIVLQRQKGLTYGEAWRSQGSMGNVARVLSKAARLKKMLWTSMPIQSAEESVEDTLLDTVNLAAFTLINIRDNNMWGND
jgi:hypothetical protein